MGGVVGVRKNKNRLSKEMVTMISEQERTVIKAGTGAMNDAILKSLGIGRNVRQNKTTKG